MTLALLRSYKLGIIFLGIILIVCGIPVAMYFSHDVEKLKDQYPRLNSQSEFTFSPKKPPHWVKLSEISPSLKWSIILSEDWGFYHHDGIDFNQVEAALMDMLDSTRYRGASTITQQMVKNVFLNHDRTLWRKLHEAILTLKVEKTLSKDRILEVYFNSIEYGPNIIGIKKASHHYFNKLPHLLGPKEGAFLAMLLPSPRRYYISFKKRKLTPFAKKRIETILTKMKIAKIISEEQLEELKLQKLVWED